MVQRSTSGSETKRRNSNGAVIFLKIKENRAEEEKKEAIQKEQERYAVIEVQNAVRGWCQIYKKIEGKWVYQITLWHWVA